MAQDQGDAFLYALGSNQAWAGYKTYHNPNFFDGLARGEAPQILWLGCSDSSCPETTILGLQPGDVIVHRNMANIISATDINTSAVIDNAVAHLKVKHVILCGHSSCSGAAAAFRGSRMGGDLDTWLAPLRVTRKAHEEELNAIRDDKARAVRLAELNIQAGVEVLMANCTIEEAIKERGLEVHGWLFVTDTGCIRDLGLGTRGPVNGAPGGVVRGKHAQLLFQGDNASMAVRR